MYIPDRCGIWLVKTWKAAAVVKLFNKEDERYFETIPTWNIDNTI
jgi:hypothetical protein